MTYNHTITHSAALSLGGCKNLYLAPAVWHSGLWDGFSRQTQVSQTLPNDFATDWPEVHCERIRHNVQIQSSEQGLSYGHTIRFEVDGLRSEVLQLINTYAYQTPLLALLRPRHGNCGLVLVGAAAFPLLLTNDYQTGEDLPNPNGFQFRLTGNTLNPAVPYVHA